MVKTTITPTPAPAPAEQHLARLRRDRSSIKWTRFAADVPPIQPVLADREARGARSVTVTSASKGWNLAGATCSLVVAGDDRTALLLDGLVEEVARRTSILGLHANVVAFGCTDWLDDAVTGDTPHERAIE